jgi:hypothetical protein
MDVSFMWQLDVGNIEGACPIKTEFTVHYSPIIDLIKLVGENQTRLYRCNFEISDHKVYVLQPFNCILSMIIFMVRRIEIYISHHWACLVDVNCIVHIAIK